MNRDSKRQERMEQLSAEQEHLTKQAISDFDKDDKKSGPSKSNTDVSITQHYDLITKPYTNCRLLSSRSCKLSFVIVILCVSLLSILPHHQLMAFIS